MGLSVSLTLVPQRWVRMKGANFRSSSAAVCELGNSPSKYRRLPRKCCEPTRYFPATRSHSCAFLPEQKRFSFSFRPPSGFSTELSPARPCDSSSRFSGEELMERAGPRGRFNLLRTECGEQRLRRRSC
ncbi:hypothetical protein ABW21_db0208147 [Orbilia brochopaga]|nr:hypothetical protein ABW21_db0208147 [Drechslerella brochopaga]